jgi:uncharacterized protein YbjT (DUF2867 family)
MADGAMLVLGATGGQGGAVLDALLTRGAQVRDIAAGSARRLADRGVVVVAGSLNDEASLAAAMRGRRHHRCSSVRAPRGSTGNGG